MTLSEVLEVGEAVENKGDINLNASARTIEINIDGDNFSFPIPDGNLSEEQVVTVLPFYYLGLAEKRITELEQKVDELNRNQVSPPLPDPIAVARSVIDIMNERIDMN